MLRTPFLTSAFDGKDQIREVPNVEVKKVEWCDSFEHILKI